MAFPTQPQRPGPGAMPAPSMATNGGAPQPQPTPPMNGASSGSPGELPGGLPPQLARHIDPNNPIQAALLKRMQSLTAQDAATLVQGVSPPALQVLKKMLPDVGFVWDGIAAKQGGAPQQPGIRPGQPGTSMVPPQLSDGNGAPSLAKDNGSGLPRPGTRLGTMH